MRNSIATVVLFCLVGLICSCGLSKEEKEAAEIPAEPQLTPWFPEEVYVTVRPVGRVKDSIKGVVPIRRLKTNHVYSAELEIYREVPVGSKVNVSTMDWPRSSAQRAGTDAEHLIITKVVTEK